MEGNGVNKLKLIVRLDLGPLGRLGPGKLQLLHNIAEYGSISAAARAMNMSYRQAWDLVHQLNEAFEQPVVVSQTGGRSGGGAALTDFGSALLAELQALQMEAARAVEGRIDSIERKLKRAAAARVGG